MIDRDLTDTHARLQHPRRVDWRWCPTNGDVAVGVDDEVGFGLGVDADLAAGADAGEDRVGDDLAPGVVHVGGQWPCSAAWEHGEVAGIGRVDRSDVQHHCGGIARNASAPGDREWRDRPRRQSSEVFALMIDRDLTDTHARLQHPRRR